MDVKLIDDREFKYQVSRFFAYAVRNPTAMQKHEYDFKDAPVDYELQMDDTSWQISCFSDGVMVCFGKIWMRYEHPLAVAFISSLLILKDRGWLHHLDDMFAKCDNCGQLISVDDYRNDHCVYCDNDQWRKRFGDNDVW